LIVDGAPPLGKSGVTEEVVGMRDILPVAGSTPSLTQCEPFARTDRWPSSSSGCLRQGAPKRIPEGRHTTWQVGRL